MYVGIRRSCFLLFFQAGDHAIDIHELEELLTCCLVEKENEQIIPKGAPLFPGCSYHGSQEIAWLFTWAGTTVLHMLASHLLYTAQKRSCTLSAR